MLLAGTTLRHLGRQTVKTLVIKKVPMQALGRGGVVRAEGLAKASEVDKDLTWITCLSSPALPSGMHWVTAQGPAAQGPELCQPLLLLDFLPP